MKKILKKCLRFWTRQIIQKYQPRIIGVTGSVGKTTTKDAIFTVLATKYRTRKSIKNYNNEIGAPLTFIGAISPGKSFLSWLRVFFKAINLVLWRDSEYPEVIVVELGADRPGDIAYLVDFIPCDIGVLTNVGEAHIEFFGKVENIIKEKSILIKSLKKNGVAILNIDDHTIAGLKENVRLRTMYYGFSDHASVHASDVVVSGQVFSTRGDVNDIRGFSFKLNYNGSTIPVSLPKVIGRHHVYAALAAAAVGIVFDMNLVEISESLKNFTPPPGRLNLIPGVKHTLILDDTYNSSPSAVRVALEVASEIVLDEGVEKFVVLGDMLELGSVTEPAHREIGTLVARFKFDHLITVGERSAHIARGAEEAGMSDESIFSFSTAEDAGKFVQQRIKEGDLILVKGSQGMRMEKVVKELMAEPLRAKELLVRQDESWE